MLSTFAGYQIEAKIQAIKILVYYLINVTEEIDSEAETIILLLFKILNNKGELTKEENTR